MPRWHASLSIGFGLLRWFNAHWRCTRDSPPSRRHEKRPHCKQTQCDLQKETCWFIWKCSYLLKGSCIELLPYSFFETNTSIGIRLDFLLSGIVYCFAFLHTLIPSKKSESVNTGLPLRTYKLYGEPGLAQLRVFSMISNISCNISQASILTGIDNSWILFSISRK